jgi:hypothetical protein
MKRFTQLALACAMVLAMVAIATAQTPQPVVRMGDWVEVGNEVWMNIIASTDIRYTITHNTEFDNRVEDRAFSRDPASTTLHNQEFDGMYQETRLGVDFRYQKSLKMRVLFENQTIIDGNLIDDRTNASNPGGTDVFGRPASGEGESTNLERFWLEYAFPGTPLRMRVGADLWTADQAGLLGDDDPRFALFLDLGPKKEIELAFWAAIQTEAARIGRVNDNDDIYYVFHLAYKGMKPHTFALDAAYFRFRATGGTVAGDGTKFDSVLIMPSWSGTMGPLTALLQFNVLAGSADSTNAANINYDIFAWAVVAYAEANLGVVRPFVGVFYGSGDDDPTDTDLNGFMTLPQREIALVSGTRFFGHLDVAKAFGSKDVTAPARAGFINSEYSHTVGNPWNDRLGNTGHTGINTAYSNPGTLMIPAGVKFYPAKGHNVNLYYIYRAMVDTALVEAAAGGGVSISKTLYHDIGVTWLWTLNSHFDIRVDGQVILPGDGTKDIAQLVTCPDGTPCDGNDPALAGEVRFRARF